MNWKNKRVLITGGAGFIGGEMVKDLIDLNTTVDILDNFSVGKHESVPEGVECLWEGDVDIKTLRSIPPWITKEYDYVFHFGAPCTILLFGKDPTSLFNNALKGAYWIREYCKEHDIPLIYASSATYYGKYSTIYWNDDMKKRFKYQEDMPMTPANIYGLTKCTEENLDSIYQGVSSLGLRIFPSYGEREWLKGDVASTVYKFVVAMSKREEPELWGDGCQMRDFIYIDDLIYCIRTLVERGATGHYNIGTGEEYTYNDVIHIINDIMGTDIIPKYVPNPYPENYVYRLRADPKKLMDKIGDIEFSPLEWGIEDMIENML